MSEELHCPKCRHDTYDVVEIRGVYDGWLYRVCRQCTYAVARDFGDWPRMNGLARLHATRWNDDPRTPGRAA